MGGDWAVLGEGEGLGARVMITGGGRGRIDFLDFEKEEDVTCEWILACV